MSVSAASSPLEGALREYIAAWNSHDPARYLPLWADDFHCHWTACPPCHGKEAAVQLVQGALSYFVETLHPTFLVVDDRARRIAMEAKAHVEVVQDTPIPFPFTDKSYKKGDRFVYATIVHFEFNERLQVTTSRSFSQVLKPDPGEGIKQDVLPGFDKIPDGVEQSTV